MFADGDEEDVHAFDLFNDPVDGDVTQASAECDGDPVHGKEIDGVGPADLSVTVVAEGRETFEGEPVFAERSSFAVEVAVSSADRTECVTVEGVVSAKNNVGSCFRGEDADGFTVVGVDDDGDIIVSEFKTGITMPADEHIWDILQVVKNVRSGSDPMADIVFQHLFYIINK